MILVFISIGIIILGIILLCISSISSARLNLFSSLDDVAVGTLIFGVIVGFFLGFYIAWAHVGVDAEKAALMEERKAIIYQLENNVYIGGKLEEFNSKVAKEKIYNHSPWINWMIPDYWDEIDLIETE